MYTWIDGLLGLLSDWLFLKSSFRTPVAGIYYFVLFVCLFVCLFYIFFIVPGTGGDRSKHFFLKV
jgi:hypothetical protein